MWCPDLFFRRVDAGEEWSFFDPDRCRGLSDVYGEEYDRLYEQYEAEGLATNTMPAIKIWEALLNSVSETGTPYILAKDAANRTTNQANLGVIKSSNLCAEIIEHSGPDDWAVCNLASINLQACVKDDAQAGVRVFDHDLLHKVSRAVVRNLNRVIDIGYLPLEEASKTNMAHRPMGIGIQGLADCFARLSLTFDGDEAAKLNGEIAATMYHAAVSESVAEAERYGAYASFQGSPASKGVLQFDMWGVVPDPRFDWEELKRDVVDKGMRNSLLIALMPTATTSQLLGNTESFEPFTSLLYVRKTLAGENLVVCKHLVEDLEALGLWTERIRAEMHRSDGSVQGIAGIPDAIKARYKIVYEIKQRKVIDLAAGRAPYVCQSQSMNLYFSRPSFSTVGSAWMYAWRKGLITCCYYLRRQQATRAVPVAQQSCLSCSA